MSNTLYEGLNPKEAKLFLMGLKVWNFYPEKIDRKSVKPAGNNKIAFYYDSDDKKKNGTWVMDISNGDFNSKLVKRGRAKMPNESDFGPIGENTEGDWTLDELAKSELQRKAAGVALQAKRSGNTSNLRKGSAAERMYNDMTEKQLADFAAGVEDGYVPEGDVMSESNIDDVNEQSNITTEDYQPNLTFTYTPDVTSKVQFIANSAEARGLNVTSNITSESVNVTCEGNITQHSALMRALSNVGVCGYVNEGASSLPNHPLASTFQSLHRALTKNTYQAQSYDANQPTERNPSELYEEIEPNDPFDSIRKRYEHFGFSPDHGWAPPTSPISEGKWSKIMQGVKKGGGSSWTVMAIENGKVVDQEDVKVRDAIPAHYEGMKKDHPRAKIAIENNSGQIVFSEAVRSTSGMEALDDIESMMRHAGKDDKVTYGQINIMGVSDYDQKTVKRILKKYKFTVTQFAGAFVDMKTTKPVRNTNKLKSDMGKDLMDAIPGSRVGVNIFGG